MAMSKIPISLLIITTISITAILNFYLFPISSPSSSPLNHHYYEGDQVPLFVNIVGPLSNPSETYEYFDMPFCPPDLLIRKKESLGEVLNGDRLTNTRYSMKFLENKVGVRLCTRTLKREEVAKFRDAIQRDFYFQMYYDGLPFWGFIGKVERESSIPGRNGPRSYLFTHVEFSILYNGNHVIEVHAFSDPNHVVEITEDIETDIQFTYGASWNATSVRFESRINRYSRASLQAPVEQLHWFSIINSIAIIMLSMGLLAILYWWNIKNDMRKYSTGDVDDKEVGWTCVDGDVFSCPSYLSLFCAVLGCGAQIFLVVCFLFILMYLGVLELYSRGSLWTAVIVMYTLTSVIAGYVAASFHCQFSEVGWERCVLLTGILFTGPVLLVMFILNTVAIAYGATAALPFGAIVVMFLIFTFITVPLLALGGIIGCRYSQRNSIPHAKRCLREIPPLSWYRRTHTQMFLGGLLPFSGILVELHLLYASFWSYKLFISPSTLFITFSIFVLLTAVLSISLTYIQLSMEDIQWSWRSVLRGGSTAIFMLAYCIYFYTRSHMSGLLQLSFFLGYSVCICFSFFLMLGAISFCASLMFIYRIYFAVKSE